MSNIFKNRNAWQPRFILADYFYKINLNNGNKNMDILSVNLKKTCRVIEVHILKWNEVLKNSEMVIKNVAGLSEQLDCIQNAAPCELTRSFPQLKDRLECIVLNSIEDEMTNLNAHLEELSQLNSSLRNACDTCYKSYIDNISIIKEDSSFLEGTSLHPPPILMIEWIDDINIHFANRFTNLKNAIEIISCSPKSVSTLAKLWEKETCPMIESIMASLHHFVHEL